MPCASPGIFYRDEIAQEFSTRMKFWSMMRNRSWCLQPGCPLWMMMSPGLVQGFWWQSTSLCSSQDVFPILTRPPQSWSCVCHCHLLVGSCPLVGAELEGARDSAGIPRGDVELGPLSGGHIFGMICSLFWDVKSLSGILGGFEGILEGPRDIG